MARKVLNELYRSVLSLTESSSAPKKPGVLSTVTGPFAEVGESRNRRRYSKALWERVLNSDYVKEMTSKRCMFGEAGHPADRNEISLPDVSHVITDLRFSPDGKQIIGTADILDTPAGRIINTLVQYGAELGISARAVGSTDIGPDGIEEVVEDDYIFQTFDFVHQPGFECARVCPVTESLDVTKMENSDQLKEYFLTKLPELTDSNIALLESLTSVVGESWSDVSAKITEIREQRTKKSPINNVVRGLKKKIEQLEEALASTPKDLSEELEGLKESLSAITEEKASLQEQLTKVTEAKESLEAKVTELTEGLSSAEAEVGSLKEQLESKPQTVIQEKKVYIKVPDREQVGKLVEKNLKLTEAKEIVERELASSKDEISKLVQKGASLQERCDQLNSMIITILSEQTGYTKAKVGSLLKEGYSQADVDSILSRVERAPASSLKERLQVKSPVTVIVEGAVTKEEKEDAGLVSLCKSLSLK